MMDTKQILDLAGKHLYELPGHIFDVLDVKKPSSIEEAVSLSKVISKLSPLLGNTIEFKIVEYLNNLDAFSELDGKWRRQDPGFPDTIFDGVVPTPGFEVKAWFPLATEITARFKDSQNHFLHDQTNVIMLAWLPEFVIYGKPQIIDVVIVTGKSVAEARDNHYHNAPDYLVLEPEDTSDRTRNLQQTNTNGHKFQGNNAELQKAQRIVDSWGDGGGVYKPSPAYQNQLRLLIERFKYRLDTNYAKMDRIGHNEIEDFKNKVMDISFKGQKIGEWNKLLASKKEDAEVKIAKAMQDYLGI